MFKRLFPILALLFCCSVCLQAEELEQYIQMKKGLRGDLKSLRLTRPHMNRIYEKRRAEFNSYVQQCNELQLDIYSNKTEYIFYMTATLKRIDKLDKELQLKIQPDKRFNDTYQQEEDRLNLLLVSLLRQAEDDSWLELTDHITHVQMTNDSLLHEYSINKLTQEKKLERDTCIALIRSLLDEYALLHLREQTLTNDYKELHSEFQSTYHYMQTRMDEIKEQVFHQRSFSYDRMITHLPTLVQLNSEISATEDTESETPLSTISSKELAIMFSEIFAFLLLAIIIAIVLHTINKKVPLNRRYMDNLFIFTNLNWTLFCLVGLIVDIYILHLQALTQSGLIFFSYLCYTILLQVSLLMRTSGVKASSTMHMYAPTLFFGFCSIFIRFFLVHESVLTLIVFPLSLACVVWQGIVFYRRMDDAPRLDNAIIGISFIVLLAMAILSFIGYVFLSMVLFFWWQAQVAALLVTIAFYKMLMKYEQTSLKRRKLRYYERNRSKEAVRKQDFLIQVTWLFDLIKMVGIPSAIVISIPFCMYTALDYFNAGGAYSDFFYHHFISVHDTAGALVLALSCYDICRVVLLFFICRYAADFLRKAYSQILIYIELMRTGRDHIEENRVNLTMGLNIINILVWAIYLATCCIILDIPTSALTFIFAGLATGIGFAMRDIINNLFYGMQLMAGRLHVGDYIVCGQYRGLVTSISYQTTQMQTEENAIVYFANSDLFSKNFQNLTRDNPYEVNRVYCEIAYGSDIKLAEKLIREAIEPFNEVDKFGRTRLSQKEGIRIEMTNLSTNGIQMAVRFGIIAEERTWFLPVLRQAIYQKLQEGGIQIPFGQMDIHMISQ